MSVEKYTRSLETTMNNDLDQTTMSQILKYFESPDFNENPWEHFESAINNLNSEQQKMLAWVVNKECIKEYINTERDAYTKKEQAETIGDFPRVFTLDCSQVDGRFLSDGNTIHLVKNNGGEYINRIQLNDWRSFLFPVSADINSQSKESNLTEIATIEIDGIQYTFSYKVKRQVIDNGLPLKKSPELPYFYIYSHIDNSVEDSPWENWTWKAFPLPDISHLTESEKTALNQKIFDDQVKPWYEKWHQSDMYWKMLQKSSNDSEAAMHEKRVKNFRKIVSKGVEYITPTDSRADGVPPSWLWWKSLSISDEWTWCPWVILHELVHCEDHKNWYFFSRHIPESDSEKIKDMVDKRTSQEWKELSKKELKYFWAPYEVRARIMQLRFYAHEKWLYNAFKETMTKEQYNELCSMPLHSWRAVQKNPYKELLMVLSDDDIFDLINSLS